MCSKISLMIMMCVPAVCGGCIIKPWKDSQPFATRERYERGLVIVLPGIEGRSSLNENICRGLNEGGVNWAIELDDWTTKFPGVSLWLESRNRDKAEELARRIVQYQVYYPGRPVVLVGQSGGGAIAAWAAETMMPNRKIDGIIMLAATLSPEYRLDRALNNTKRGIISFYSDQDWVLATTKIFLTMDGKHSMGAGRVGFEVPTGSSMPAAYRKLYQVAWNEGGHISTGSRGLNERYVAPLVLADQWNAQLIRNVLAGKGR